MTLGLGYVHTWPHSYYLMRNCIGWVIGTRGNLLSVWCKIGSCSTGGKCGPVCRLRPRWCGSAGSKGGIVAHPHFFFLFSFSTHLAGIRTCSAFLCILLGFPTHPLHFPSRIDRGRASWRCSVASSSASQHGDVWWAEALGGLSTAAPGYSQPT